jgi:bacteriorhodopsin
MKKGALLALPGAGVLLTLMASAQETTTAATNAVANTGLTLSSAQFLLVYQMLSITIACMGAAFIFLVIGRSQVGEKYRPALLVSAIVVAVACYHYVRIFNSWTEAFGLTAGSNIYAATGIAFNDAYRYADWVLTVPLLLVETVAVLALAPNIAGGMIARLALAAFIMIVTGYPGEISDNTGTRLLWGTISTIPFVYILYVLWVQLGKAMEQQPERVRILTRNLRLLLLGSWGFYPIAYLLPVILGSEGLSGSGLVALQVGYSLADIIAKAGFGVLIYFIAREKTAADPVGSRVAGAGAD